MLTAFRLFCYWLLRQVLSLRYRVRVHKKGDSIHVEHVDAPPTLPRGGLNCTMNVTAAHSSYPLKCMLTPNVRGNAGCYAPISVVAPEGSALNCKPPAAVAYRVGERSSAGGSYVAIWRRRLVVGEPLPSLPLPLTASTEVIVDCEETYTAAARRAYLA